MGLALIELYIAKKCLIFLAARAYGFKPLYRRCLEFNNRVFDPRSKSNERSRWMIRHSFDAVLKVANWVDVKARGTFVKVTGKDPPAETVDRMSGPKASPKEPPKK